MTLRHIVMRINVIVSDWKMWFKVMLLAMTFGQRGFLAMLGGDLKRRSILKNIALHPRPQIIRINDEASRVWNIRREEFLDASDVIMKDIITSIDLMAALKSANISIPRERLNCASVFVCWARWRLGDNSGVTMPDNENEPPIN